MHEVRMLTSNRTISVLRSVLSALIPGAPFACRPPSYETHGTERRCSDWQDLWRNLKWARTPALYLPATYSPARDNLFLRPFLRNPLLRAASVTVTAQSLLVPCLLVLRRLLVLLFISVMTRSLVIATTAEASNQGITKTCVLVGNEIVGNEIVGSKIVGSDIVGTASASGYSVSNLMAFDQMASACDESSEFIRSVPSLMDNRACQPGKQAAGFPIDGPESAQLSEGIGELSPRRGGAVPISSLRGVLAVQEASSGAGSLVVGANGIVGEVPIAGKQVRVTGELGLSPSVAALDSKQEVAAGWSSGAGEGGASGLRVLELRTGTLRKLQRKLPSRVTVMRFQPDTQALLIGAADGRLYRWRYAEEDEERSFERYFGPATVVSAVAGLPGGRVFFSGDWTGGLSAWLGYDADAYGGRYDERLLRGAFAEEAVRQKAARGDSVSITEILIPEDGKSVLVVLGDGRVEAWFVRGLIKLGEVKAHQGLIYAAALSRDGSRLATLGRDGFLKVFALRLDEGVPPNMEMKQIGQIPAPRGRAIAFFGEKVVIAPQSDSSLLSFDVP